MSQRSEIWHRETSINLFEGSIHRLFETITVWAVKGGAILMDCPVHKSINENSTNYIGKNMTTEIIFYPKVH